MDYRDGDRYKYGGNNIFDDDCHYRGGEMRQIIDTVPTPVDGLVYLIWNICRLIKGRLKWSKDC